MRNKFMISSKLLIIGTIVALITSIISIFIAYSYHSITLLQTEIRNECNNIVSILSYDLEDDLKKIEITMFDYWANDINHMQLYKPNNDEAYFNMYDISKQYNYFMNTHEIIGGMAICSPKNNLTNITYKGNYSNHLQSGINNYIRNISSSVDECLHKKWYVQNIEEHNFLFRVIGNNKAYNICFVDLENIDLVDSVLKNKNEQLLLYSSVNGEPLTHIEEFKQRKIQLHKGKTELYISKGFKSYYIVQQHSDYLNLNMVYIIPNNFLFNYTQYFNIINIVIFIILVFLIFSVYLLFKNFLITPLIDLTEIMRKISIGNLNEKMDGDYRIKELGNITKTFNLMIENVNDLKIEKYELELKKQKAEMQYLQLQIKPHFFLNCLKTLYGMAEQKKIDNLQNMILAISNYIRYMFKCNLSKVPLKTEIEYAENYIKLQEISSIQKVSYSIKVEEQVEDCLVPPLCIQTFLENSFKYAIKPDCELQISINVVMLCAENKNYIDISVQNNGGSFTDDFLQKVNKGKSSDYNYEENNTGILNLRQRILCLYGEEGSLICMNNEIGTLNEIILPTN